MQIDRLERVLSVAPIGKTAVHHRCITGTAFDGLLRRGDDAETAWVSQMMRSWRTRADR
jgi:hypothetical protein